MSNEDDRGYFRVATRVGLSIRVVSEVEWEAAVETIETNAPLASAIEPETARILDRLEQKLDLVLEHLGTPNPQRIRHPELQDVQLSGSGVRLSLPTDFAAGDRVQVELDLSPMPTDRIVSLGTIVVSEPGGTAIRFDVIREEDRDRIVQHTLAVERSRVRHDRSVPA